MTKQDERLFDADILSPQFDRVHNIVLWVLFFWQIRSGGSAEANQIDRVDLSMYR